MDTSPAGAWTGCYHDGANVREADLHGDEAHRFPIRATLEVRGKRLVGTMIDEEDENAISARRLFEIQGRFQSPRERANFEEILFHYPDAIVRSHLPEHSELEGWVNGPRIRFTKRYVGVYWTVWELENGKSAKTLDDPQHSVVYDGQLSPDGKVIEGTWTIYGKGWIGRFFGRRGEGTFRLERL